MVHAQSLRGYRELVNELGGDAVALLSEAGIDPSSLDQLTTFIPFENQADLLERSAQQLGCPDFGLRLAGRQDIGILGILAVAMRYSSTVGEALQCLSKYLHVYNSAIDLSIGAAAADGHTRLVYRLPSTDSTRWAQATEHGLALTWRVLTLLSEARCHLYEVHFPHSALVPNGKYRTYFDAPARFDAEDRALEVAASDLDLPMSESIAELRDLATRYIDSQLAPTSTGLTAQVRHAVDALLGTGTCDQRAVASALHLHPRTLQRRLHGEATNFEAIKDEARQELAKRYLAQPDLSVAQIAALLDYGDQSAFGRSCRRWFNATPRDVRRHLMS
jgi:AraC-like DNA-binding protein